MDQKNKKAFATGGDVLLANGEKIPLPGGFALPTSGLWSGLLDIPQVRPAAAQKHDSGQRVIRLGVWPTLIAQVIRGCTCVTTMCIPRKSSGYLSWFPVHLLCPLSVYGPYLWPVR